MNEENKVQQTELNVKFTTLPHRNQFGMISIVDEEGNIHKTVKSVTAAAKWITKEMESLYKLSRYVGMSLEDINAMSVYDLQREIATRI